MAQQVNVGVISTVKCVTTAQTPTPQGGKYALANPPPAPPTVQPQPTPVTQNWIPQAPLPNNLTYVIGVTQTFSIGSPPPTD